MTIGWDRLSAYVDGELDAASRAEIAAALAREPDIAARVASLKQLKAATAASGKGMTPPPPFVLLPRENSRVQAGFRRQMAMAAVLVLAVVSGAAFYSWQRTAPGLSELGQVSAMNNTWTSVSQTSPDSIYFQAQFGPRETVQAPDLTEAKLKLVYQASEPKAERSGIFLGYLGPNGCRLGLWVGDRNDVAKSRPELTDIGGLTGYVWMNGKHRYALVSKSMDPSRLGSLASIVADIIERDHRLNDQLRTALRATATTGSTCAS